MGVAGLWPINVKTAHIILQLDATLGHRLLPELIAELPDTERRWRRTHLVAVYEDWRAERGKAAKAASDDRGGEGKDGGDRVAELRGLAERLERWPKRY